jgi:hypothetical protein
MRIDSFNNVMMNNNNSIVMNGNNSIIMNIMIMKCIYLNMMLN